MTQSFFSIGELAKKAGVNVETIRFYQRRNLLRHPVKPFNGIRHYTERDAQRVRFIKQGQKLGFTLDELKELMSLEEEQQCQQAQNIALKKLSSIRERIEGLKNMEKALSDLIECCSQNVDEVSCPIIMVLLNALSP